jgi:hypothetical protein
MDVCVLRQDGEIRLHRTMQAAPEPFLKAVAPYRAGLGVAVACLFPWYWLADLCPQEGMPCVRGHALLRTASHGGKATNDTIDAHKRATLRRGGRLPQAYVYPAQMRATRDLVRHRTPLRRQRAALFAPVHNTHSQYHLPEIGTNIASTATRDGGAERLHAAAGPNTLAAALALIP